MVLYIIQTQYVLHIIDCLRLLHSTVQYVAGMYCCVQKNMKCILYVIEKNQIIQKRNKQGISFSLKPPGFCKVSPPDYRLWLWWFVFIHIQECSDYTAHRDVVMPVQIWSSQFQWRELLTLQRSWQLCVSDCERTIYGCEGQMSENI